ncbi:L-asparagine permease [Amycolatopsis thailandensis]|uniref:L-asparagine permease n=2 Tax=Amycolatopsis thailandensis TaxID=589330 RepID=A0A229S4Z8_9PSEU|nr:amino acid permease [Amycolatopsis thailandensis]OXM54003.1 L-asparagine permease [Amycolatopsis thailandensis]
MDPAVQEKSKEEYSKSLGNRHVQMIAIGGAIGVGLFLGAGGRLAQAGPALILSYAVCGIAAYFVMRALGELVLHNPSSGSFVTYARRFIGPWAGFAAGWMYWLNWAMTGIAEITAVAIYVHKWLPDVPQWVTALIALGVLLGVNMLSVRLFGELEFWFSVIKVLAIVVFLAVGAGLVLSAAQVGDTTAGVHNLTGHGGFFPSGIGITLMTLQAVVFAYAAIEVVGITAGETKNPEKVLPKAINGVVWRIAIFYVGSVVLLTMLLPWSAYRGGESPFVTVFTLLGIPGIGDVMNAVVLTAALSSCNSGLYSTGRILRALAEKGEAPAFVGRMNRRQVPFGGILFTAGAYLLGVGLNYLVPTEAFDIAVAVSSIGVVSTWATLLICQMRLRKAVLAGEIEQPSYRMPGAPYTGWLTLGFLGLVLVLMGFSTGPEKIAFYSIPVVVVVLAVGWRLVSRNRVVAGRAPTRSR